MINAALAYLKKGCSVIPVGTDKRPLLKTWLEYQKRLPNESEVISWWKTWPDAQIALVTGSISGVTVVDFDVEKDKDGKIVKMGDTSKFPETDAVKTPSGGLHYYYAYHKDAHTGVRRLPLVDIRNDGGYVLVPPSKGYVVVMKKQRKPFPIELFGVAPAQAETKFAWEGVTEGSRNDNAAKITGRILAMLPKSEWATNAWEYVKFWNSKNIPPLSEHELRATFSSIANLELKKRQSSIGGYIEKLETEVTTDDQKQRLLAVQKAYNGDDRMVLSSEIAERIKTRPEEEKILSGWFKLDAILKGFRLNQVVVIAAPTKNGKTSFCMDMTAKMKEYCPAWFPLEEGAEELLTKFIERQEEPPLFATPNAYQKISLAWIEQRIIEALVKYNSRVVFIDHLHFIVPFSAERTDLRIGETMRELKTIAKRWNVCIFIIAHLKKTRLESQPELDDLRDSSFIGQEADTVIFLWREAKKIAGQVTITNNVNVSVQANRRTGSTGNIKMTFRDGHFYEEEWQSLAEQEVLSAKVFKDY